MQAAEHALREHEADLRHGIDFRRPVLSLDGLQRLADHVIKPDLGGGHVPAHGQLVQRFLDRLDLLWGGALQKGLTQLPLPAVAHVAGRELVPSSKPAVDVPAIGIGGNLIAHDCTHRSRRG
jgi:hypothetical protein